MQTCTPEWQTSYLSEATLILVWYGSSAKLRKHENLQFLRAKKKNTQKNNKKKEPSNKITFENRCFDLLLHASCKNMLSKQVTGHFVPRSFRTQVISYHFGHFVPTFIFSLVISYPVWSFRTHFVPSLVVSYLLKLFSRKPFWSVRTYFYCFVPKSFHTRSHFVPI